MTATKFIFVIVFEPDVLAAVRVTVYDPVLPKVTKGFWAVRPVGPALAPVEGENSQFQEVGLHT